MQGDARGRSEVVMGGEGGSFCPVVLLRGLLQVQWSDLGGGQGILHGGGVDCAGRKRNCNERGTTIMWEYRVQVVRPLKALFRPYEEIRESRSQQNRRSEPCHEISQRRSRR